MSVRYFTGKVEGTSSSSSSEGTSSSSEEGIEKTKREPIVVKTEEV